MGSGKQAWFDVWAMKHFLRAVGPLVPHTLLPVLRCVSGDPARIDREYANLIAGRVPLRWNLSPRERCQRQLSAFALELGWVCRELDHFMSPRQYEALVTGTVARLLEEQVSRWVPDVVRFLSGEAEPGTGGGVSRLIELDLVRRLGIRAVRRLQPLRFLVGEMQLRKWSVPRGEVELWIPRCELRAAAGDGATQVCSRACKGAIESVLGGRAPLRVALEPAEHGSCEVHVQWDAPGVVRLRSRGNGAFVPETALLRREGRPSQMWN